MTRSFLAVPTVIVALVLALLVVLIAYWGTGPDPPDVPDQEGGGVRAGGLLGRPPAPLTPGTR